MKRILFIAAVAVLLSTVSSTQSQGGQGGGGPQQPVRAYGWPGGGTREVLISVRIPPLPNAPFTAVMNTEWTRTFADGTTSTLVNRRMIARDRNGRVFQERRLLVPANGSRESAITQTEISDVNAHEMYLCRPQSHACELEQFNPMPFAPPPTALTVKTAAGQQGGPTFEDLGTQSIAGVQTEGTRESNVIPTGAIGNDNPILVTREYWYSAQLGINLLTNVCDPRFGTQKFEFTDISMGDPDPSLFQIPARTKITDLRSVKNVAGPHILAPAEAR